MQSVLKRALSHLQPSKRIFSTQREAGEKLRVYTSSDEEYDPRRSEEPLPEPPNPMMAVSAMGIGAFFAIGIAAVGVYSAFYMAAWTVANSNVFPKVERGSNEDEAEFRQFLRDKLGLRDESDN